LGAQAIETFRVSIANGVLVLLRKPFILIQFFELRLAGVVVDLVGKIGRENKRLVADDADGEGECQLIPLYSDEDPTLIDVPFDIIGNGFLIAKF
jgi:hypothetical protein